ncbi:hypothetical protein KCP69_00225 [Salmonella enterica subsp. enterica]|nr:hypothetical protein KCP69_00225 [Salmonella enterica subsp. enterica]
MPGYRSHRSILDIFAQRARTHEGKLQVELAQLRHLWLRVWCVAGPTANVRKAGWFARSGETQLETDRRLLRNHIVQIQCARRKLRSNVSRGGSRRIKADVRLVSLWWAIRNAENHPFNQITEARVYAANQLFATLDPLHRIDVAVSVKPFWRIRWLYRHLPHDLVAAFKLPCRNASGDALLLHVVVGGCSCAGEKTSRR